MPEQKFTPRVRRVKNDEQERLQYVSSLLAEKRTDEARDELLSIVQQNPKSVPARLILGSLYQNSNNLPEALEQFRQAIASDPMDARAHLLAGVCIFRMDDLAQASKWIQTALDLDPKLASAHVAMAQILAKEEATSDAINYLELALRLDPQMTRARLFLARLLGRQGRIDDAVAELEGCLSTNPQNIAAMLGLAHFYSQQNRNDKAIALLESAIQMKPQAMLWTLLGRIKMNAKDYGGAEAAFVESMKLPPRDPTGVFRLVDALIPQGKLGEAGALLQRVPRHPRLASRVHQCYGDIYASQNMEREAFESYRAALLHSPGGETALKEVEESLGGNATFRLTLQRLQAALLKQREEARKRFAQRDWESTLEQLAPQFGDQPTGDRLETY